MVFSYHLSRKQSYVTQKLFLHKKKNQKNKTKRKLKMHCYDWQVDAVDSLINGTGISWWLRYMVAHGLEHSQSIHSSKSTKHTQTSPSAALSPTTRITTAIPAPNPRVAAEHTGCSWTCRVKGRSPCALRRGQHLPVESRLLALVLLPNTESKSMLRPWGLCGCWSVGEPVNPGGAKTQTVRGGATTTTTTTTGGIKLST